MKIFISWSGSHARAVAEVVRAWLDDVFDAAEPFMSQSDIVGGTRPLQRIEEELAGARFGVIIVTAANQHAPWITFEAGALSKVVDDAGQYVMPMLLDLRISDLTGPLTQFQAAHLDAGGVKKMVLSIGHALGMEKAAVERKVETFWPRLEEQLQAIPPAADEATAPARGLDEVVEEILTHVRELRRDVQQQPDAPTSLGKAFSRRSAERTDAFAHYPAMMRRLTDLGLNVRRATQAGRELRVQVDGPVDLRKADAAHKILSEEYGHDAIIVFPSTGVAIMADEEGVERQLTMREILDGDSPGGDL